MSGMFEGATAFNGNLTSWNVSSVTDMSDMFSDASSFNQTLNDWDVSSVLYMYNMFLETTAFNGDLAAWDVSSVTDMLGMFEGATAFNGDLAAWDVSSVIDMSYMFSDATAFNRSLNDWNVSSVTSMTSMFEGATSFQQNLGKWYVVPDSVSIARTDVPGVVGSISAQNTALNSHNPVYNVAGSGSTQFAIVNGNQLNMTSVDAESDYTVNVTASGDDVFEDGNNWKVLEVMVTDAPTLPAGAFVTTWKPVSGSLEVRIPVEVHTGETLSVSWGDGESSTHTTNGIISHEYDSAGEYQVAMTGGLSRINLGASSSTASLLESIDQWGDIEWVTMNSAFLGASSMVYNAIDAPDLSGVTDMYYMFRGATSFDKPLNNWNVSAVTEMNSMFYRASSFNGDLSRWNVSSVTDMSLMFFGATAFNRPLNNWNVSAVTEMNSMFYRASSFNGDLSRWNVSSVTDMSLMFFGATAFNRPLNDWNVSSVTDMSGMFYRASSFNGDISGWDVSSVTNMNHMFDDASSFNSFNSDLSRWNVSSVTSMNSMFYRTSSFNQTLNAWDVSSVTDTSYMFLGASSFNQPLNAWDVSSVTTMIQMFNGATSFNQPLNNWDVSSVTKMNKMFNGTTAFDQNLGNWYVVPDSVSIALTYVPGVVGSISTQNSVLDRHSPTYGIGTGGDSNRFEIVNDNQINMTSVEAKSAYKVNVTAPGGDFGTGNHRILNVTVTDSANTPPTVTGITGATTINEDTSGTLTGVATDGDGTVSSYLWSVNNTSAVTITTEDAAILQYDALQVDSDTAVTFTLTVTDNDGATGSDTYEVTINNVVPNSPPTVNAGQDQEVAEGDTVTLSGTATDGDPEDALAYSWTHDGTLAITITDSDSLSASFAAPNVAANTTVTVTLTVNDGTVDVTDTLQVTITDSPNAAPTVNAGQDQEVAEGDTVTLSGTATDGDPEDALTYEWTHDGTLAITITDSDSLSASFAAPNVAANTTVTVTLTVNDGTVNVTDTLQVTITDSPNAAPTVNAGQDQEVAEGATVTLSGTATDGDPEDTLTYSWTHDGTLAITFATPAALSTTFAAPDVAANTTVTVTLTVNDGTVDVTDTLQVTITDSPNAAPTVNAGQDQEVAEGDTVTLSGTATDGDPEDALAYSWTHDGTLAITFATPAALSTTFAAPNVAANTTVTVTLTVNDGTVDVTDTLQVTITDSPNAAPTVNAGQDQEVVEGATVTLSGTATDGDPEDALTYSWTHDGTLAITFATPAALSTTFAAPGVAANTTVTVTLTVNDGTVNVTDTLQVTITDSPNAAPTVNAGQDQEVVEGATVTLSGTATDGDPEDALTYSWTHDGTLAITITGSDSLSASFAAPNVAANTTVTVTLTVNDGTVNVTDTLQVTITDSPNAAPTVNAGQDQEVAEGATVTLSGTATDGDPEDALAYEWTHDGTLAITITDSDSLSASFAAPDVAANTTVTVTLTVNDGTVDVTDTLQVTITDSPNAAPTVNAGQDQEVAEGATVTLSGTATDGDPEDALTYSWTHDGTLAITFATPAALSTTFAAPDVAANTTVTVTLTVNDGTVNVTDTLQVTITDSPNAAPTVNAGQDQEVAEGATVTLSGTATDGDPEDTLAYSWTHDGTLAITITGSDSLSASFAAPDVAANTTVTVTLTVNDGTVNVTDTLQVTITDSPNAAPTVNAGQDQEVVEGATVTLSGTATDGDPEDALTYEWTHDGTLAITITGSDSLSASFAAPNVAANTTVTVTLTVNDGTVNVTDTLQVTITDSPNAAPTVNAGQDQEVVEGATVTLSGTATDGDPEDALTYEWTHDGTLAITITGSDSLSASFAAPNVAANTTVTVTLTVNDGTVNVTDTLQVTITDSPNAAPTVNAGQDQEVVEGATVTLSGTATDGDPEDALTYEWTHDGTLAITITGSDSLSASFAAPNVAANTTVTVTLTVNDGTVNVTDTLQVTITDSPNAAPTVNAGQDQEVVEGATVTLSGTATDGDPEDTLTYEWTHDGTLAITITGSDSLSASFAAPNVAANTTVTVTLTVNDGTVNVTDTLQVTITDSPNAAPTVNAGQDQEVVEGATVTLSGTATDDDGDTLTYEWTHDGTLAITITGSDSLSASFAAPNVAANTTVTVTLTVNDGTVNVTDTLQVTITDSPNAAPTVNAGQDQEVVEGATVTLSGTATDDDGDTLTYEWTHDGTLAITITGSDSLSASFAAPNVAANTTVTVTLTVNDGTVNVTDTLQVTITDSPNAAPTVNAGQDQEVVEGATVTLSGTATDDDGDTLTYEWTHDGTLAITITGSDSLSASFAAPGVAANTTVTVTLTVNDGTVNVTDTLQVTITDSPNAAPTVNAGQDQEVVEGATVTLSGTATDDDGDTLTYEWTHDGTLAITITGSDSLSASFAAPNVAANTTVTVTLTVNDGTVNVTDTLQVTITDSPNAAPTVNAGQDQEVVEGATVTLSGTATDDDGDTLTYEWTHDGTLAITITGSDSLSASFAAPGVAANTTVTVTLTVNDGTVNVTDTLQVTITDSPNAAPTVNAGQDQEVVEGATVTLSGTATDDDGDTLTYEWTHDGTLAITITGSDSLSASFAAPGVAANTTVTVTLTVNDGTVNVTDTLQVTITDSPNAAPTVNAGQDQEVVEGATVTLSGTATDGDPEDTLTYEWTHDGTLAITITGSDSLSASFAAPNVAANTTVTVTLTVNDGTATVSDTVTVTITDSVTMHDMAPRPVSARASSSAITLTLSEVVTSSRTGPNGFSVESGADPVSVDFITGSGTKSLVLGLTGSISAPATLSYSGGGNVADEDGRQLGPFDLTVSFQSEKSRSASSPAITADSQDYPSSAIPELAMQTAPEGPLQPVPADGIPYPLIIDENGYALHSATSTVMPTQVTAGQPVTIKVTMHDPTPIAYFAVYLNLQNDDA